jgi:hypothetical protein
MPRLRALLVVVSLVSIGCSRRSDPSASHGVQIALLESAGFPSEVLTLRFGVSDPALVKTRCRKAWHGTLAGETCDYAQACYVSCNVSLNLGWRVERITASFRDGKLASVLLDGTGDIERMHAAFRAHYGPGRGFTREMDSEMGTVRHAEWRFGHDLVSLSTWSAPSKIQLSYTKNAPDPEPGDFVGGK